MLCGDLREKEIHKRGIYVYMGFPGSSAGKESACSAGELGLIPGLRRSLGEGSGYPLQYSGLENSMDRGAWWATYSPWRCKELDRTERLTLSYVYI